MPRHWSETVDWIWGPNWDESRELAMIVQFRRRFRLEQIPSECPVHISADTRYRLYVNGHSVCFGPAKSHLGEWNYETVDIASFCRVGHNAIAVRVLRYSAQFPGNMSLARANQPGLIVHSAVLVSLSHSALYFFPSSALIRLHLATFADLTSLSWEPTIAGVGKRMMLYGFAIRIHWIHLSGHHFYLSTSRSTGPSKIGTGWMPILMMSHGIHL